MDPNPHLFRAHEPRSRRRESAHLPRIGLNPAVQTTKYTKHTKAETDGPMALFSSLVNDGVAASPSFFVSFVFFVVPTALLRTKCLRRLTAAATRVLSLFALLLLSLGCRHARPAFFPLGIYAVPSTNDLMIVREAGFNLVTGPAEAAYLDAAQREGLKVLATPGTTAGPGFRPKAARRAVAALDAHPALWAWYLVDEPDLHKINPRQVREAQELLKRTGARKPTALTLYTGANALHYANLTDILMIDRYPIPWLPLANFGQHVQQARLALGQEKPLIAIIQSFDWTYYPDLLLARGPLRPPTYDEVRCMTYCALAQRATGLFYCAYADSRWKILDHPQSWLDLQRVVWEVNERLPLFQAEHRWWPHAYNYRDWSKGWNAALESSISLELLRVRHGSALVPAGDYVLAVNTTPQALVYSFTPPRRGAERLSALGENRSLEIRAGWVEDEFAPYAVHVYGPVQ